MTEAFYQKFVSFLFGLVILIVLAMIAVNFILFYLLIGNLLFYVGYFAILVIALVYGLKYSLEFHNFKENMYLLIPRDCEKHIAPPPNPPLEIESDELAVRVCVAYRNGGALRDIQNNMGHTNANQAKRALIHGIDFLLKFYAQHRKEVKK